MSIKLFKHQKEGIEFLKKTKKAILADSMGLGKTKQAILAAGQESTGSILVICPASLKINWEREIHVEYPDDEVIVIASGPEEVIVDCAWIIINYDMLGKYNDQLTTMIMKGDIQTVILDESHYIKGKSIRASITLEICEKAERVYCLTGTPVMNRPIELFNQLRAIGHPFGKNRSVYGKRYCGAYLKTIPKRNGTVLRFWDESGSSRLPELKYYIKDVFLRRTKEEVLDLPDKIITTLEYELSDVQRMEYDEAWEEYLAWVEAHPDAERDIENIKDAQQLIELGKLKQVCSLAKVKSIADDIENAIEQGEKVIVFSQYKNTIHMLKDYMDQKKIGRVVLTGENDSEERQKAVDDFQNKDETKVFIANIKAGGVGITLTAASIVIFADMEWSPEIHNQAMDRAHRIGQTGTVNVYYYVAKDTIEGQIVELLSRKKDIISQLV